MMNARSLASLQEMVNIGVGKGAQVLNTLLIHHVVLDVPTLIETTAEDLMPALGIDQKQLLSCVQMAYRGSLQGEVQLLFSSDAASQMVSLIIAQDVAPEELDFIRQATLTEVGNIVINAVIGTVSNLLGFRLEYTLPTFRGGNLAQIEAQRTLESEELILLARTTFTIEALSLKGNMILFFSWPTYKNLESALERYVQG